MESELTQLDYYLKGFAILYTMEDGVHRVKCLNCSKELWLDDDWLDDLIEDENGCYHKLKNT